MMINRNNMKILFIIDGLYSGGKERQLIELIKGLTQNKISFEIIVFSEEIHYSYIYDLNVKIHFLKRKIKKDPLILIKIYKICKMYRPDIIHTWDSMSSVYAVSIAKILGIKLIDNQIQDAPAELKPFKKGWIRTKLTFPFSDIVLANSKAGLKSYKAPINKSHFVHNGFDFDRIRNLEKKEIIRKKFNIVTPHVIGMVARFHKHKDYPSFISAAIQILDKRNDVTFLAVGDGETLNSCKGMVKQQFVEKIKFTGNLENVESLINIFDIGILLTDPRFHGEGISNSIMEYMALEKPVIASNGGGTNEIVEDNVTGFIVEPLNIDIIVEKILLLLENKERSINMGKNGKEKLLRDFGLEKMTNEFIQLYKICLNNS